MITESMTMISRSIIMFNSANLDCLCTLHKTDLTKEMIRLITRFIGEDNSNLIKNSQFIINQCHLDMIKIITNIEDMNYEQAEIICPFIDEKGSYFKFTEEPCCMEILKAIREPGTNEEHWKHRKKKND